MIYSTDIEQIGKFLKTHALKGELNAQLEIDSDFLRPEIPIIMDIDGIFVPLYPESVRPKGHFTSLVKLDGIDSEAEARQFVNKEIYARISDVEEFVGDDVDDEEGAYADDLVGYELVSLPENIIVGEITEVDCSTANVLFIVDADGERVYVPASPDLIDEIDTEKRSVYMTLPDGLLELNLKKQNND